MQTSEKHLVSVLNTSLLQVKGFDIRGSAQGTESNRRRDFIAVVSDDLHTWLAMVD